MGYWGEVDGYGELVWEEDMDWFEDHGYDLPGNWMPAPPPPPPIRTPPTLQEQGSALETSGWPAKGPGFLQLMSRMTLGMVVGLQALSHPGHQHHPGPEGIKATMKKSWKL